jgi:hypothetical protein
MDRPAGDTDAVLLASGRSFDVGTLDGAQPKPDRT